MALVARKASQSTSPESFPAGVPWIGGLASIADKYDVFLVDLWGVVHNGSVAFPWAIRALEQLRAQGKKVVFLSNSSRRCKTNTAALERMGVTGDLYSDLLTSGEETWKALAGEPGPSAAGLPKDVLAAETMVTLGNGEDDNEYLDTLLPSRRSAPVEDAQLVLARGCSSVCDGEGKVRKASWLELEATLKAAASRGLPMLCANPDVLRPDGDDSPMPGRLAAKYVELGGPPAHYIGKPYRGVFDAAMSSAGLSAGSRVCMVGDSAWHDVRGARSAGIDVVLLCTGVHYMALGIKQAPARPVRPSGDRLEAFLGALAPEEQPTYVAAAFAWDDPCSGSWESLGAPQVITCGLACLDHLVSVESFPVPDMKSVSKEDRFLGGGNAANTACALARFGLRTALVTKVGDDAIGEAILEGLRTDGVDTRFVVQKRMPSVISTVLVDQTNNTRTSIHTPIAEMLAIDEAQSLAEKLFRGDARHLHLDGRHPEAAGELAEAARSRGLTVTLDAESKRVGLERMLAACDGIFCNQTFPQVYTEEAGLPAALAAILDKFPNAGFVVATRGERGSLLLARKSPDINVGEDRPAQWASEKVPVTCCHGSFNGYHTLACDIWPLPEKASIIDSTGAGDNFIAGFLCAWLAGKGLSEALASGSFVATVKLQQMGARLGPAFDATSLPFGLGQQEENGQSH